MMISSNAPLPTTSRMASSGSPPSTLVPLTGTPAARSSNGNASSSVQSAWSFGRGIRDEEGDRDRRIAGAAADLSEERRRRRSAVRHDHSARPGCPLTTAPRNCTRAGERPRQRSSEPVALASAWMERRPRTRRHRSFCLDAKARAARRHDAFSAREALEKAPHARRVGRRDASAADLTAVDVQPVRRDLRSMLIESHHRDFAGGTRERDAETMRNGEILSESRQMTAAAISRTAPAGRQRARNRLCRPVGRCRRPAGARERPAHSRRRRGARRAHGGNCARGRSA